MKMKFLSRRELLELVVSLSEQLKSLLPSDELPREEDEDQKRIEEQLELVRYELKHNGLYL
jgi:hypothetical protein